MKTNRISAYFFLCLIGLLFVFHFILFSGAWLFSKKQFRESARRDIKNTGLQLTIKTSDLYKNSPGFEWKDNNKELVINGRYHEIFAIKIIGQYCVLSLVPDEKENRLLAGYFEKDKGHPFGRYNSLILKLRFVLHHQTLCPLPLLQAHCMAVTHNLRLSYGHSGGLLRPPQA